MRSLTITRDIRVGRVVILHQWEETPEPTPEYPEPVPATMTDELSPLELTLEECQALAQSHGWIMGDLYFEALEQIRMAAEVTGG